MVDGPTRDPLEATTGNPYGYTDGNPLQFGDPLGLDWWNPTSWTKDTWSNIGAVAATVSMVVGIAAVTVATGGAASPLIATGLTTLAVGSQSMSALIECTDGGPREACRNRVATAAVGLVGAAGAASVMRTAWGARHVAENGRLVARMEWLTWEGAGDLAMLRLPTNSCYPTTGAAW